MGERRARNRRPKYRTPIACGLAALLVLPVLVPRPSLGAGSSYDTLAARLSVLVNQRTLLLDRIAAADGLVGSRALADLLGTLRSPLDAQAVQARRFAEAWSKIPSPTPTPRDPAFYRGAEAGVMAGSGQPVDAANGSAHAVGSATSDSVQLDYLAGEADAPIETAPRLPPIYDALSTAQDPAPLREIGDGSADLLLRAVAPQAVASSLPALAVTAPPWTAPTLVHGAAAASAYSEALGALAPSLGLVETPASLPSTGVNGAARPRTLADLRALLGHYQLPGTSGRGGSREGGGRGSITWELSAAVPIANGTTLQVQGSGTAANGQPGTQTYSVISSSKSTGGAAPSPLSARVDIASDGSAILTATTTLSDSTTLQLTARLPNVISDPKIAGALAAERPPLSALSDVLRAGDSVYAALTPLYQERAGVYQQALGVAMRANAALEQRWWDQTQRWDAYQTALGKWKQKRAAWRSYLARTHPGRRGFSLVPAASATPLGDFAPDASATPTPDTHLVTGPGPYEGGAPGRSGAPLGVGGGPAERVAALGEVTPIFVATDTPVPSASGTIAMTATNGLSGTTNLGVDSPTVTPSASDTASVTDTASATPSWSPTASSTATPAAVESSATATPSETPSTTVPGSANASSPSPTSTSLPGQPRGSQTATTTATDSPTPSDTVSASPTPAAGPTGPAVPVEADTAVPADSPTPSDTPRASATDSATPSASASPTATPSPSASATSTGVNEPPSATATPVVLLPDHSALLPPGPAPASVPPPGAEPQYVPLPAPLSPLPPWVDAPIAVTPTELRLFESDGPNAAGYASMTASQLIAGGALDNVSGYIPPLQGMITTLWGGSTPFQSFHPGVDIATAKDTPVHAAADGIVVYAGLAVPGQPTQSYGNCVVILHNAHISTMYGHMDMGQFGLQVQAGQVVRQGQVIGYEGQTGWATGPHVHFEMRLDNVQFDPLLLVSMSQITG
ncbi:MAG TPA: peptidoglycan DD-metalloendopeptidase family protein [Chloroflexota bacterium]|nr:peptidoglycan DD-metalloendopeptidase family protein [Chloroflexota bacterium]